MKVNDSTGALVSDTQEPHRVVVLVPSYNPGAILEPTVRSLLDVHSDVWVLVDGSTDRSEERIDRLCASHGGLRLLRRKQNLGKGATVLEGAQCAHSEFFTHVLCFDADGQHPPERVPDFLRESRLHPRCMVMGEPRFGRDAPVERVYFRRLANVLARLETGGRLRWDSLFGMRVYPIPDLLSAFSKTTGAKGYDFESEIAVRMVWDGVGVVGVETVVRYPGPSAGGVSHFRYIRDNLLLARMHWSLLGEAMLRFAAEI